MAMIKALEIVIEKVRKLPEDRQEHFASILEDALAEAGSESPLAERPMGFMADAFEITGDIVDTSALWERDSTVENWDRLMFQLERDDEAKARKAEKKARTGSKAKS